MPEQKAQKIVALISGGIDSTVALSMFLEEYPGNFEIHALTFRYGQTHDIEVMAACSIVNHFKCEKHEVIDVKEVFAKVATKGKLTTTNQAVGLGTPDVYVPGRNFIFVSLAAAYAVSNEVQTIVFGPHATDSPFPDCRSDALKEFAIALYLGTPNHVNLVTPLLKMTKTDIVRAGDLMKVPFELTTSCYYPTTQGKPCYECLACKERIKAFQAADIIDPRYQLQANTLS